MFEAILHTAQEFGRQILNDPVIPPTDPDALRRSVEERFDFREPKPAKPLLEALNEGLKNHTTHVTHPRYFGLFNPTVRPITVAADALAALYNPQLAVWAHSPFAVELERRVLRHLARPLDWGDRLAAHFTSGGQQANATAVAAALTHQFPQVGAGGLRSLDGVPTLYASELVHDSFEKIAHSSGLGRNAVRRIPVDNSFQPDLNELRWRIKQDRNDGCLPFLLIGTGGTTSMGTIDPLAELAGIARQEDLWFHVDAAWGGLALLSRKLASSLSGIERADSVTWDAHKGLSVPFGAGMFFSRHAQSVQQTFDVKPSYVDPSAIAEPDNYRSTMLWSRRFMGLKVAAALAELGEDKAAEMVEHQAAMAARLREMLRQQNWDVVNDTPLPLVCFRDSSGARCSAPEIVKTVLSRGRVWISHLRIPHAGPVLRACITNYRTGENDLTALLQELELARDAQLTGAPGLVS